MFAGCDTAATQAGRPSGVWAGQLRLITRPPRPRHERSSHERELPPDRLPCHHSRSGWPGSPDGSAVPVHRSGCPGTPPGCPHRMGGRDRQARGRARSGRLGAARLARKSRRRRPGDRGSTDSRPRRPHPHDPGTVAGRSPVAADRPLPGDAGGRAPGQGGGRRGRRVRGQPAGDHGLERSAGRKRRSGSARRTPDPFGGPETPNLALECLRWPGRHPNEHLGSRGVRPLGGGPDRRSARALDPAGSPCALRDRGGCSRDPESAVIAKCTEPRCAYLTRDGRCPLHLDEENRR
ncbi:hypothetical protein [Rhodococcus sp. ABRD24]|uniref:hypothetical protein n=1 Tax=Rhodococcus sp. ABRD24 TaxID=2507582 RepID=UPI00325AA374